MGKFVFGLIVGVILVPIIVYLYFMTGMAPVATTAPPMPFEKMFARMALHARMGKEVPKTVPIQVDESNLMAGAQAYKENCAVCHGLPDGRIKLFRRRKNNKPTTTRPVNRRAACSLSQIHSLRLTDGL